MIYLPIVRGSFLLPERFMCIVILAVLISGVASAQRKVAHSSTPLQRLWYTKPADRWLDALPLGNGSLGAMIFGGVDGERIQFNESSLCTGSLDKIGSFQPFGNIFLAWKYNTDASATAYRRSLVLNNAIHETSFKKGAIAFKRVYFTSHPDQALVGLITASKPKSINVEIKLKDVRGEKLTEGTSSLFFQGKLENGISYAACLIVKAKGGVVTPTDSSIIIRDADALNFYLTAATSFKLRAGAEFAAGENPEKLVRARAKRVSEKDIDKVLTDHKEDFSGLFDRVTLKLGDGPDKPTLQRLQDYTQGASDHDLEALLFQYGRYLLISSSRAGGTPANLQGLWNNDVKPEWYSQYTTNINIQMNYWSAEPTNLSECHEPLFDWVENLAAINRSTSDNVLKTSVGWVTYSTDNLMGGGSTWRIHRPGSAWLSQHFWERYAFTGDSLFLARRAYPLLKELVSYWDGHLVETSAGKLISPDGWSPEHGPHKDELDKRPYPGASYDQQIVYDLFTNYIDAAKKLKIDDGFCSNAERLRSKLLGPRVGKWGQLQEWAEDLDDSTDHHRHNSHLFAVYPGRQITLQQTPQWARAASRSLLSRGMESTGWSVAWRLNLWARLADGEHAYAQMRRLIQYAESPGQAEKCGLYANLFNAYPFQLDGNFGYTSAVAEMLLQSHENVIHLLPALPKAWADGEVKGLKARGNVEVAMRWKSNHLVNATLKAVRSGTYTFRYGDKVASVYLVANRPHVIDLKTKTHTQ
ncbi:glycoside hydrolase family 95 protein [Chryseolinea lacunae]|uniref:Glycoside hydrolase family 95 protein n=1 Tax=Chryseolinea lacunae TaxID=2801331 RepID=A0ABS1L258_9BACT|nr:glycoside hydrolase family 95 protein [Chryseolinea lacunae]MBL0745781.1 glycoside hydrolase family 95 protein [Chryseolinea lacunae]